MSARTEQVFGAAPRIDARRVATIAAVATLFAVPLVPGVLSELSPIALLALPVESIVVVLLLVIIGGRTARAVVAGVFGALVVAAILVSALDLGFRTTIDRPFNLADDGGAVVSAFGVVADSAGLPGAVTIVALLVAAVLAGAYGLARAALRVGRTTRDQVARGRAVLMIVAGVWIVAAVAHAHTVPGVPAAASRAGDALVATSARAVAGFEELRSFELALGSDPMDAAAPAGLFTALAGKDVVLAFVESYGRVAVEPADFTGPVTDALEDGAETLAAGGYSARSAFLTSPTFGGVSWLAHSTLQSGVWVDSTQKYARLLSGERQTLASLFGDAGWQTMAVVPSNEREWAEGERFYGYDSVVDARTMGYRGPSFGYAAMPDQYTWREFDERLESAARPVMAEVDLVSSHTPWTPLPQLVGWSQLGDGSVFASQAAQGESAVEAWADPARVRELYADSVAYSLDATFSYLRTHGSADLVLVLVGDHQPSRIVSGLDAGHDVPVTIIARDPAVLERIASWGWEDGIHPSAAAPVWRMDAFRDRFVDAFSD